MIVKVRVIPNAFENEVISRIGSVLRVRVAASSVNQKANDVLKGYLAEFFQVPTRKVLILRGANGREKTIEITGKTEEQRKRVMESIP